MKSAIETAQALVRIPSVNPHYDPDSTGEEGVAAWIEAWAETHGLETRFDEVLPRRRNLLITLRNPGPQKPRREPDGRDVREMSEGSGGGHFLLAGHMDTVSTGGMEIPPFGGDILDGRLMGRGSADMKGPLAAMLHTLPLLRDQGDRWSGVVSVACVVDEEYLARGIKGLMARSESRFDYAVIGEPTGMKVLNGCKGCLRFTFAAIGRSAHSSTPCLGRNAIVAMSAAILALDRYFNDKLGAVQRAGFGSSTGSIGLIAGGTGVNIVPDRCEASVDIRLIPGQDWKQVYADVRGCLAVATAAMKDIAWTFDAAPFVDPCFETPVDHPLVRAAVDVTAGPAPQVASFSCDASKVAAAGVPCIILGPGEIAEAHTSRESIPVDEIDSAVTLYAGIVRRLLPPIPGSHQP